MAFTRKKIIALGCALGVILVLALIGLHVWQRHLEKAKPNPHPKYFVTIKGNIQPDMPYPMTTIYKATYAAYNPTCGVWISRFEGVSGLPAKTVFYPARPDKQGNYKIHIPIDAYQLGKCQWKIAWVMQGFVKKIPPKKAWPDIWGWNGMISFGKYGSSNELPSYPAYTNATFYCGHGGIDGCTGTGLIGGYVNSVSRKNNYNFIQNIKAKKEKKNDDGTSSM